MKDDEKKTSHLRNRGELPFGWTLFFMTAPEFWIPGLIAFLGIRVFGIPEESGPAVFFVFLIALFMAASGVAVYLFGQSLKRGRYASKRSERQK